MTSTDPPKKHQSETIDYELARSRANLRSLAGEIAEAQSHPLGLQAKRASLQNSVDEHPSVHIRRLPTELLVRVFMLALPTDPSLSYPGEAPVVLGQVCRLWRAVSRSTPLLWSTIRIKTINAEECRVAVLEWLERSHRCPLTVYVELVDGPEWGILAGIAARIEHLDIQVVVDKLAQLFSVDCCNSLDALQSLRLEFTGYWEDWILQGIQIDLGTRAPRLARIHACGDLPLQHLILPSIQITTCAFSVGDNTGFTLFLQEAVNLIDCTIFVDNHFRVDVSPRSPVRHTRLEKLKIRDFQDMDRNALGSILPCLDLPSLCKFQWDNLDDFGHYGPEWPITTFLDFLSRSGCTLSKLWIGSGPTDEDILRYLVEVPSVVDLAITPELHGNCPRELMRVLTLGSHSGPEEKDLVPNLEHLTIRGAWYGCEEMMQAIESRISAVGETTEGRRLKRVTLAYGLVGFHALGDTEERLDKCVREGLLYDECD